MKVSIAILARNEEKMMPGLLACTKWADEVVVGIDTTSNDSSYEMAMSSGAKVLQIGTESGFARAKNELISKCSNDWVFVLDADERVTGALANIVLELPPDDAHAYELVWQSYYYGHKMQYTDTKEVHTRLFRKSYFKYVGEIHEELVATGPVVIKHLNSTVAHFSHRSVMDNLPKTMLYADIQARQMLASNHPAMGGRSLAWVAVREFYKVAIRERIYRDGPAGVVEMLYRPFSWFVVYARLWELQQSPSIDQQYSDWEKSLT